jgi:thioredoxin 1
MAEQIKKSDFDQKVIKSEKAVLVDFFASWCGPCKMMEPVIEEVISELKDEVDVYKVDVDRESDLANDFQVMSVPTIIIFKKGKIVKHFVGVTDKNDLIESLKK